MDVHAYTQVAGFWPFLGTDQVDSIVGYFAAFFWLIVGLVMLLDIYMRRQKVERMLKARNGVHIRTIKPRSAPQEGVVVGATREWCIFLDTESQKECVANWSDILVVGPGKMGSGWESLDLCEPELGQTIALYDASKGLDRVGVCVCVQVNPETLDTFKDFTHWHAIDPLPGSQAQEAAT